MATPALSVRVVLGGVPVVQREVSLYDVAGRLVSTQTTNADGRVTFKGLESGTPAVLPGAEVRVAVEDPLFDPVSERVVLCADGALDLKVELRPVRGLRLDVFTYSSAGAEDVPVVLRDEAGTVIFNLTSQDGAVAFECGSADGLLAPGKRYVLRVEDTAFRLAEYRFVYVENQSVTLFLEPAGAFSVQLLDGGLPRPGLAVALRRGITEVASGVTDAAGVARFDGSRWDLELGALYAVIVGGVEEGQAFYEADGQTAVLDAQDAFTAVLVNGSTGKAASMKTSCQLVADGMVVDSVDMDTKTGKCEFGRGVARGMVLRVSPAGTPAYKAKEVVLSGYGFKGSLEVVLTQAVSVTVTVKDTAGSAVSGAHVQARRADGALSPVFEAQRSGVFKYSCTEGTQMELGDHQTLLVSADGYVAMEQAFVVDVSTALEVKLVEDGDITYEIEVKDSGDTAV